MQIILHELQSQSVWQIFLNCFINIAHFSQWRGGRWHRQFVQFMASKVKRKRVKLLVGSCSMLTACPKLLALGGNISNAQVFQRFFLFFLSPSIFDLLLLQVQWLRVKLEPRGSNKVISEIDPHINQSGCMKCYDIIPGWYPNCSYTLNSIDV